PGTDGDRLSGSAPVGGPLLHHHDAFRFERLPSGGDPRFRFDPGRLWRDGPFQVASAQRVLASADPGVAPPQCDPHVPWTVVPENDGGHHVVQYRTPRGGRRSGITRLIAYAGRACDPTKGD